MEKSKAAAEAVCAEEALNVLNCVAESSYDQDKCVYLLNFLRTCVLQKKVKKFSLADQKQGEAAAPPTSTNNKA